MPIRFSHNYIDRVTEYRLRGFPLVTIGRFSYINQFARIHYSIETSAIRIGNFCSIASDVGFFLRETHHPQWVTTASPGVFPFAPDAIRPLNPKAGPQADIVIGNDVWIGEGARILSGVTIGDGAIIGAAAVVTKDVPPYAIYVGNPGRIVRRRFTASEIKFLLRVRWWDFPTVVLRRLAPVICSTEFDTLRRKLGELAPADIAPAPVAKSVIAFRHDIGRPEGYRRSKLRRSFEKRLRFVRGLLGLNP